MQNALTSPEGMTKMCLTLGYSRDQILAMLTTRKYGLTQRDAEDMLARVSETTLAVDEL